MTEAIFIGVKVGDWLQAVSTVLGILATVGVTLWIERRTRTARDVEDNARLKAVVSELRNANEHLVNALESEEPRETTNIEIFVAVIGLADAIEGYRFVREDTRTKDVETWRHLKGIDRTADLLVPYLELAKNAFPGEADPPAAGEANAPDPRDQLRSDMHPWSINMWATTTNVLTAMHAA